MLAVDILEQQQDDMKSHAHEFILWPRQWEQYKLTTNLIWEVHRLDDAERAKIPNVAGVYTLLVQPGIADHPGASFLMYVGKTKSLNRRFGEYLNEGKRITGRPKLFRLLRKYPNNIWFCFSRVSAKKLRKVEDDLIVAYIPPANDKFPASISKVVRAF